MPTEHKTPTDPLTLELMKEKRQKTISDRRNEEGMIMFCMAACVLNMTVWPVMVAREVWQWKHYRLQRFEWDDIIRYTLAIIGGSIINTLVLFIIFN